MSDTKHTKGPWEYVDASKLASYQYKPICVIKAGQKELASFSWNDSSPWFPTKEESQANARLIAAAPMLLELVEHALKEQMSLRPEFRDKWFVENAEEALATARA